MNIIRIVHGKNDENVNKSCVDFNTNLNPISTFSLRH